LKTYDFVVIGAGSAGRTAVETLVDRAPDRTVLLADAEDHLPYKRTQVSKNVVRDCTAEDFAIHGRDWYRDRGVDLRIGTPVESIDTVERTLQVGGETAAWDRLLFATGSRPRIPRVDAPEDRFSTLWTVDDTLTLRRRLEGRNTIRRVAVVGSGVLGVEAASQLSLLGCETVLIGRNSRPMRQYLDDGPYRFLEEALRNAGVGVVSDFTVDRIGVSADGRSLDILGPVHRERADFVVLATGSEPVIDGARRAGLDTRRGILVDGALRTSAPGVWAAGDCAEHPGGRITGLWHAAEHQGRLAARSMAGDEIAFDDPPFRLKTDVFGGTWFSAGRIDGDESPEEWAAGGTTWWPRFRNDRIIGLTGAAPEGMDKAAMKRAQALLLDGADTRACRGVLRFSN